jgi:hypothetical protein
MEILFSGKKNISILPSGIGIADDVVQNLTTSDTLTTFDDYYSLLIGEYAILYDRKITAVTDLATPTEKLDVYLADITQGYEYHLAHLEKI